MATILRSNALYTGTATLPRVDGIVHSESPALAAYKERVAAAGGEIVNESYLNESFAWAEANGVMGSAFGFSASWGIKRGTAGKVERLFGLNGLDVRLQNSGTAMATLETTGQRPVIRMGADRTYFETEAGRQLITGRRFSTHLVADLGATPSGREAPMALFRGTRTGNPPDVHVIVHAGVPGNSWRSANWTLDSPDRVLTSTARYNTVADNAAYCAYVDMDAKTSDFIVNGVSELVVNNPNQYQPLNTFTDVGITLGHYMFNDSGQTWNSQGVGFSEVWILGSCTRDQAISLSTRLGDRY